MLQVSSRLVIETMRAKVENRLLLQMQTQSHYSLELLQRMETKLKNQVVKMKALYSE